MESQVSPNIITVSRHYASPGIVTAYNEEFDFFPASHHLARYGAGADFKLRKGRLQRYLSFWSRARGYYQSCPELVNNIVMIRLRLLSV